MEALDDELLEGVIGGVCYEQVSYEEDPMLGGRCPACASLLKKEKAGLKTLYYCPNCKNYVKM